MATHAKIMQSFFINSVINNFKTTKRGDSPQEKPQRETTKIIKNSEIISQLHYLFVFGGDYFDELAYCLFPVVEEFGCRVNRTNVYVLPDR